MRHRNAFAGWLVTSVMVSLCVAAGPPVTPASVSGLRDKVAAAVARDVPSGLAGARPMSAICRFWIRYFRCPPMSRLRVASVRAGYTPGSWLLRLECRSRRDCLPFDVVLHAPGSGGTRELWCEFAPPRVQEVASPAQLRRSELGRP